MDGSGGSVQKDVVLQIQNGRIGRIVSDAARMADPLAVDLDCGDCTVIPGLIDSHVHLFMSASPDPARRQWQLNTTYAQMAPEIAARLERYLACGVAALRDGGDYGGFAMRFKQAEMPGGRWPLAVHVAGRAWRKTGRYGKLIGRAPDHGHDLALAIAASTERVDHIKIVNSGLNSLKTYGKQTAPQFSTDELRAAVQAAEADDKKVMVHVNGAEPIRRTIAAGGHSIEHGFFMGTDNVKRLADAPIFWVPTAVTMAGYARHAPPGSVEADVVDRNLDHQLEQMRQARELGVKVAVGTDAGTIGVHHGRALQEEIALLLSAGFTIPEAVRCATRNGALLMGLNRAGKIAPGFRATLLALPGGPQAFPENLSTPVLFMVDGQTQFDHRIKLNRL